MSRKYFAVFVTFFALLAPLSGHAIFAQSDLSPADRNCVEKMRIATDQYVKTYPGLPPKRIEVVTFNDLMCTDPEWMMNIVVVIENPNGSSSTYFGIFHIHFLSDGTFLSAVRINDPTWAPMVNNNWWRDWCGFLKTVYPADYEKECPPTPDPMPKKP